MSVKEIAVDRAKRREGLRLKPYHDTVNKLTIGYGRNLDDMGITEAEAEAMLNNDIERVMGNLEKVEWYTGLDDARKAVIVDMAFNMGLPRLFKFKKMIAAIKAGDYETAADEMVNSKWYGQVGERAVELVAVMRGE